MHRDQETASAETLVSHQASEDEREAAALSLGDVERPAPEALAALLRASLADSDEDVRLAALNVLVRLAKKPQNRQRPKRRDQPAFDMSLLVETALRAAMHDRSEEVRAAAVSGGANLGDRDFARELAASADLDPSDWVRKNAAEVLRSL